MDFNNFTTKAQEAVQKAQQFAQELGHQQIENEHLFKAITLVDENVT
ncbi:MAG TPA: Clp protease N-terminal domain-containing protein, partial [Gillisia sp.]|nr:Clp protease N-terminal domain-containing protein [Gillisia sp.]